MTGIIHTDEYRRWIISIKQRIQASQLKAAVAVNRELLDLYWYLGEQILEKQKNAQWGEGFMRQMSLDLLDDFPDVKGFSVRNLQRIRRWYQFWTGGEKAGLPIAPQAVAKLAAIAPQLVAQIPWGHNAVILEKLKNPVDALFTSKKPLKTLGRDPF